MERLFIKVRSFKLDAAVNGMNPRALFKYRLRRTANRVLEVNTQWLWPFSSTQPLYSISTCNLHHPVLSLSEDLQVNFGGRGLLPPWVLTFRFSRRSRFADETSTCGEGSSCPYLPLKAEGLLPSGIRFLRFSWKVC
jgi:hypothetical protein